MTNILIFIVIQILYFTTKSQIYIIKSVFNDNFISINKNRVILSNKQTNFLFNSINFNFYYIEIRFKRKRLGINDKGNIIIRDYKKIINNKKFIWKIIYLSEKEFIIKNIFNDAYIEVSDGVLQCYNNLITKERKKIKSNFKFLLFKMAEEGKLIKKHLKFIKNEPIDLVIKYIDLTDKNLKREEINQIYKDNDNEELRYCIRSVLQYMPWIRKIFILMPNDKVKYFKSYEVINNKIIYIKDKDLIGFESANIHSFTFKLYGMKKFGIANNFIYMEDDFFIGKFLNKKDFFYYDEKKQKVLPYITTKNFEYFNATEVLNRYFDLYEKMPLIHPHSYDGWWFSIYSTNKYFMERYSCPIINTNYTHNTFPENIEELREIFEEIKYYKYINKTLFSNERNILTLNQPQFWNLYQLNIKHQKVNSIPYKYISIENLKKSNLDLHLFVINTGGNHIPSIQQYKIEKKIMQKRFSIPTIFEIRENNSLKNQIIHQRVIFACIYIFIKLSLLKLIKLIDKYLIF